MPRPVLLIGSFPYKSAAEVFDVAGPALADYAARLPDGEAQGWNTFPAATLAKAKGLEPSGRTARPQPHLPPYDLYRLSPGIAPMEVEFAPVGYDRIALASYEAFKRARRDGRIAPGTRFQVSLPTPFATIGTRIVPEQVPSVLRAFERHFHAEVDAIVRGIPTAELAIQWDVAVEIIQALHGYRPGLKEHATMDFLATAIARSADHVPADAQMGLHFCYGNPGGKHVIEPTDTRLMTEFANAIFAVLRRPATWIHMPVPKSRDDDAYFAPLRGLALPAGTEFYLGLVHLSDGIEGTRRRMETAKRFAPRFGVACECGLRAFPAESIPAMLALHRAAADLE